jgi:hypothetical protein
MTLVRGRVLVKNPKYKSAEVSKERPTGTPRKSKIKAMIVGR